MRTTLLTACVAAMLAGCYQQRDLPWYVEDPTGAIAEAETVQTYILEGGCADFSFPEYEYRLKPLDEDDEAPREIEDGEFCFIVQAFDASCTLFARAQDRVTLPLADGEPEEVVSTLERLAEPELCAPSDGVCTPDGCVRCTGGDVLCDGPPRCCPIIPGEDPCAQDPVTCDAIE